MTQIPRWLLLAALVFAPWAYGATRPWAIEALNVLCALVLGIWILGCLVRRSWPQVPRWLWLTAGCLVLQAWWMVGNAKFDYAPDPSTVMGFDYHQRFITHPLLDGFPGSYHKTFTLPIALRATLLLGVLCFVCDLVQRAEWRRRLMWTMMWTGVSLVVLGMVQRLTQASSIFWQNEDVGNSFFATYRYHSNAGAFINLVWPLIAGLLVGRFDTPGQGRSKILLGTAAIVCLAGVLANTSRAAAAIAVVLLVVWGGWLARQIQKDRLEGIRPATAMVTLGLLVLISGGVAVFPGVDSSLQRWSQWSQMLSAQNSRWLASRVCWDMLPEAGWWGFGPGTFQTMFPYFTNSLNDAISGVWIHAHQDYLETLIEWGYLGGLGWAMIFGGALWTSWQHVRKTADLSWRQRALHFGFCTALWGVLLHAGVDFPLQIASIQLYVAVLLGFLWGAPGWLGRRRPHPPVGLYTRPFPGRKRVREPAE